MVEQTESGLSAIKILEQTNINTPFDLMFIDEQMPEINGVETIRKIQSSHHINQPPTIIMALSYDQPELKQVAKDILFASMLYKPILPSSLYKAIQDAFGYDPVIVAPVESKIQEELQKSLAKLKGAKILLVEDNEINMELAVDLLTNHGIQVECAFNGKEALEKLQTIVVDGVLMDCQMPIMDGYEATRKIKEEEKFFNLPVIAMTANVMQEDIEKVSRFGMIDHIAKPIQPDIMFITMAKWIKPSY